MALRTPLCDMLGIEHPVMQGSPGPWSSPALTAAISEAGGLGSLGTALVAPDQIRAQVERVRSLTDRPFAVNHTLRPLSEEAYALTLELGPPVISALRTPFIDAGNADPAAVEADRERLAGELVEAVRAGGAHELVPFAGQTAGLIGAVQPAGEIVRSLVADAEAALRSAAG
jgi:enoyl-[acyl-carrier protein] reductase II